MITRKTTAFIVDDSKPEPLPEDPGQASIDHGDIATPEPEPPTDDDRPLD